MCSSFAMVCSPHAATPAAGGARPHVRGMEEKMAWVLFATCDPFLSLSGVRVQGTAARKRGRAVFLLNQFAASPPSPPSGVAVDGGDVTGAGAFDFADERLRFSSALRLATYTAICVLLVFLTSRWAMW